MPAASLAGRSELLGWLNRTLGTDYLRLEECADCVAYAQLIEAVHPGTVPLHRLHFRARRDAERQHNAKILAAALHRGVEAAPRSAELRAALAEAEAAAAVSAAARTAPRVSSCADSQGSPTLPSSPDPGARAGGRAADQDGAAGPGAQAPGGPAAR